MAAFAAEGPIFTPESPDTVGGLPVCFLRKNPPFEPVDLTGVRRLHRKRRPVTQGAGFRRSRIGGLLVWGISETRNIERMMFYGANSTCDPGNPISRSAHRWRCAEEPAVSEAINLSHMRRLHRRGRLRILKPRFRRWIGAAWADPALRNPAILRAGCVCDVRCRFRGRRPGSSWWEKPPPPQRPEIAAMRCALAFLVLISYVVI